MAWLSIIGVGESGIKGLDPALRQRVLDAGLMIGADRMVEELHHHADFAGEARAWPTPFLDIIPLLEARRGKPTVIIATGDPLWFGAASTLVRYFDPGEMEVIPSPSGFQLAAARMGWPLNTCITLTVHGRPHESVLAHLAPRARLLVLAHDHTSTATLAGLVTGAGFGDAVVTALGHIGGEAETRQDARASAWVNAGGVNAGGVNAGMTPPDFHITAIECPDGAGDFWPRVAGLPDHAYQSDGKLTKAEVRAATLARLAPHPGGVLWDLGCGSGSIGIEWMRAATATRAIGIDQREDRLDVARANAARLGVPDWQGISGMLPDAIADLPRPDAVFIGGGLSLDLVAAVMPRLNQGGRLVVNTVTLESEALLLQLWGQHGGELTRIATSRAEAVGPYHGWRPLMPVTQWYWRKSPGEAQ